MQTLLLPRWAAPSSREHAAALQKASEDGEVLFKPGQGKINPAQGGKISMEVSYSFSVCSVHNSKSKIVYYKKVMYLSIYPTNHAYTPQL